MCKARRKLLCPRVQFSAKEVDKGPGREAGDKTMSPGTTPLPLWLASVFRRQEHALSERTSIVARPSPRPDLLVFEVRAKITEPDIEGMAERVQSAFDALDHIDILLLMSNFEGAELSAIADGEAMRAMTRSITHVRRYVVVGAPAWAQAMINVFGVVSPVHAKTFDLSEEALAWEWINRPGNE